MKRVICLFAACVVGCYVHAQGIVVNPDGSHSVVVGNIAVNPDGTHSVIMGNIAVNPNGTHSIVVNPDETSAASTAIKYNRMRMREVENYSEYIDSIRMAKIEKKTWKRSERKMKRDARRQERQNN